jgi:hypothetical protein
MALSNPQARWVRFAQGRISTPLEGTDMNEYRHHVSGFFASREEADTTASILVRRGLVRDQLQILEGPSTSKAASAPMTKIDGVLQDVLVDGAIGPAVGTGIGALAEIGLVVANVSLFIASPLIAPLVMLGWGGSIGALVGASARASAGAGNKPGWFSGLVHDAVVSGQVLLVARTRTAEETAIAREVIQAAVGECKDVSVA